MSKKTVLVISLCCIMLLACGSRKFEFEDFTYQHTGIEDMTEYFDLGEPASVTTESIYTTYKYKNVNYHGKEMTVKFKTTGHDFITGAITASCKADKKYFEKLVKFYDSKYERFDDRVDTAYEWRVPSIDGSSIQKLTMQMSDKLSIEYKYYTSTD